MTDGHHKKLISPISIRTDVKVSSRENVIKCMQPVSEVHYRGHLLTTSLAAVFANYQLWTQSACVEQRGVNTLRFYFIDGPLERNLAAIVIFHIVTRRCKAMVSIEPNQI